MNPIFSRRKRVSSASFNASVACPSRITSPVGRKIHRAAQVQQSRFTASTPADQCNEFSRSNLQGHFLQCQNGSAFGVIHLADVPNF